MQNYGQVGRHMLNTDSKASNQLAGPSSIYIFHINMQKQTSDCEKYATMTIIPKFLRPKIFSDFTNVS